MHIQSHVIGYICLLLLFTSFACSCVPLRKKIYNFERQTISLPKDMITIKDGQVYPFECEENTFKLVVYIDSTQCSECTISHMYTFDSLFELCEKEGLCEVLLIISPQADKIRDIQHLLSVRKYPHPVVLDYCSKFAYSNSHIPSNRLFHSFVLDTNNLPVLVGNPMANKQMQELFLSVIQREENI